MKLHFAYDWVTKFEQDKEDVLELGTALPASMFEYSPQASEMLDPQDWKRFPLKEMAKYGWLQLKGAAMDQAALLREFLSPLDSSEAMAPLLRQSIHKHSVNAMDNYALLAWVARVTTKAKEACCEGKYIPGSITPDFLREVATLSCQENGPLVASEFLSKHGVALVIERHLSHTYLDGAAFFVNKDLPVVGLTLRHDRLDSFWFTLLHELAHVSLHLSSVQEAYFDDVEGDGNSDPKELEADRLARESFIPRSVWRRSEAFKKRTHKAVFELAHDFMIHPAVVAGRLRREANNYKILNDLVGMGGVRKYFDDVKWN